MKYRRKIELATILFAVAAIVWAQTAMRAGQYEVTTEIALPGAPPMKATELKCLSAEEARDAQKMIAEMLASEEGCAISNITNAGNKLTWDTACDGATASSELTFAADGFKGIVKTIVEGMVITADLSGRRVAEACTAGN
jgi:hypothetical protein